VAINVKKWFKGNRLWIGAAGVGGVIALVMIARRGGAAGSDGDAAGAGETATPSGYYQGTGNTMGTDIAGFLSQWFQSNQQQQQEFYKSTLEALKGAQTPDGGGPTGTASAWGGTPLAWFQGYQSGIAGKYVAQYVRDRGYTGSWADIVAANPGTLPTDPNTTIPYGVQFIIPRNK
jgi:hypothetical protein